jgi:hypothetical protein
LLAVTLMRSGRYTLAAAYRQLILFRHACNQRSGLLDQRPDIFVLERGIVGYLVGPDFKDRHGTGLCRGADDVLEAAAVLLKQLGGRKQVADEGVTPSVAAVRVPKSPYVTTAQ